MISKFDFPIFQHQFPTSSSCPAPARLLPGGPKKNIVGKPRKGGIAGEAKATRPWWEITVDGRNPAPVDRWFIPLFIYRVSTIQGGAGFLPSTVNGIWPDNPILSSN